MLRWFRRTRVKLGFIGGLLADVEILMDLFGIGGDLLDALQQVGSDVLPAAVRLIAFGLSPLLIFGAFVAVISAAWTSLRWLIMAHDALRENDNWAARQLRSYQPRIQSCVHELRNLYPIDRLENRPGLLVHLNQLAKELARLGVNIAPDDTWNASLWHYQLTTLVAQASYGDIKSARRLKADG